MIALHTGDMWQSVRYSPNGPGNRPHQSMDRPFGGRALSPAGYFAPLQQIWPDTLAIPRPLSLQRGIPRQLVLVKNYRRIFARPSRENMAVSFRKIRKKIGILYKILCPARCRQALGNGRLFFMVTLRLQERERKIRCRESGVSCDDIKKQTCKLQVCFLVNPKGIRILDLTDAKRHIKLFCMISNCL